MSSQENKKTEKYKLPLQQHFTFHAFHPKAVNVCLYLAGLLAFRFLNFLPIRKRRTVDIVVQKFANNGNGYTATGIAPELNRTSLLIICLRQMNQVQSKCRCHFFNSCFFL
jgi:hypothetical protein